jgi:hypothetical protein
MENGRMSVVRLCGDLIAPAHVVAAIEDALTGQPPDDQVIARAVARRLETMGGFVLGASAQDIARVTAEAARS